MKRLLIFIALLSILVSCKKTSYVAKFDKTPQERAADQISLVSTTLTSAPNGWIATLPTRAGGGYAFLLTFDNEQNVSMYGDLNDASATTFAKSYYRVKQDIGTDLVFDSYSYLAMLNDPNSAVLGGQDKIGYQSDIDFTYDRVTTDSIIFIGKKYRQPFKLVKATAAQRALYEANGYKTAIDKFKTFFSTTKNPYIEIVSGSTTLKAGITVNSTNSLAAGKRISFTGLLADGKTTSGATSKFAFKIDGVDLLGGGLIYQGITFVKFLWKDATTLAVYDSTGKEYIVKSNPTPLTPLHLLLGAGYNTVSVPNATTYPGWGSDFVTRRATAAQGLTRWSITNPRGALRLQGIVFTFNNVTKRLAIVFDTPDGTNAFSLTYNYTYTKTEAGVYKFTLGTIGGNESAIGGDLAVLLADRIQVDTFTADYFTHPTTGVLMAQLKSIEHPDFTFTGAL